MHSEELHADVAVLHDSAVHGTVADADLQGLDPQRRAVVILERGRYAWTFDPDRTPPNCSRPQRTGSRS